MKRYLSYLVRHCLFWLPDNLYLRLIYWIEYGETLNLKNPESFQEKLQYLKLYNRHPQQTILVDKYAVKDFVSNIIGSEYVVPTIGLYKSFDDIDFNLLPDKFVLKTTHGGGGCGIVICNDKAHFNLEEAKGRLINSLNSDIYKNYREWPYRDVPRMILVEKFIEHPDNEELYDYKFFCFDGEPQFFKIDFGRFQNHHANYYDMQFNLLSFGEADYPPLMEKKISMPDNFDKMIEIVRKLSKGQKFIRVDLYNVDGKIYFGELTFFPASGFGRFTSKEWELKIGNLLNIDNI